LRQATARSQAGVQACLSARNVPFTPFWVLGLDQATRIGTVAKGFTTFNDSPGRGNHSYRVSAVSGALISSSSNVANVRVR